MCPRGYYCDNSNGVVVINDTIQCPPGSYCPNGKTITGMLQFIVVGLNGKLLNCFDTLKYLITVDEDEAV